jgi:peroxiredoxin
MKYFLFSILILLAFKEILPQTINIKIDDLRKSFVLLSSLKGEDTIPIDSVLSNDTGEFRFLFDRNKNHIGFYRLSFSTGTSLDFVFEDEDISIRSNVHNIQDSLQILKSQSNKVYYEFLKSDKAAMVNPKSFIARYIRSSQMPLTAAENIKAHYLDKVDFDDDDLIYSDLFINKARGYLNLYRNSGAPKEELEKEYIIAVDTLLNKAKVNVFVYEQITGYLINRFRKNGYIKAMDYIVDNYVIKDDICLDEKVQNTIQNRIDQSKYLKTGVPVPDIILPDPNGKEIDLSKLENDKILILFYASWCPHCQRLIPKLIKLYLDQKEKKLEVYAVSIDTNKTDWIDFINKYDLKWINVRAINGRYSKIVRDYHLYSTPTMIFIDKNKKVISLPNDISELTELF